MRRAPPENVATVLVNPHVLADLELALTAMDLRLWPVWIGFAPTWQHGDEPLPWVGHATLWQALDAYAEHGRFHRRLGGVSRLPLPEDAVGTREARNERNP